MSKQGDNKDRFWVFYFIIVVIVSAIMAYLVVTTQCCDFIPDGSFWMPWIVRTIAVTPITAVVLLVPALMCYFAVGSFTADHTANLQESSEHFQEEKNQREVGKKERQKEYILRELRNDEGNKLLHAKILEYRIRQVIKGHEMLIGSSTNHLEHIGMLACSGPLICGTCTFDEAGNRIGNADSGKVYDIHRL